jgi:hypothetical protein
MTTNLYKRRAKYENSRYTEAISFGFSREDRVYHSLPQDRGRGTAERWMRMTVTTIKYKPGQKI